MLVCKLPPNRVRRRKVGILKYERETINLKFLLSMEYDQEFLFPEFSGLISLETIFCCHLVPNLRLFAIIIVFELARKTFLRVQPFQT